MGYGNYERHLLDQDPLLYHPHDSATCYPTVVGVPAAPQSEARTQGDARTRSDFYAPRDAYAPRDTYAPTDLYQGADAPYPSAPPPPYRPRPKYAEWQEEIVAHPYSIPPHQRTMAKAVARDHGRQFKVALNDLYASEATNVREVRRLLELGRRWWHAFGFGTWTIGLPLHLAPARLVITPDGFFTVAKQPVGNARGRLAPLCSTDFGAMGTPTEFMTQVHSELNSILRRRTVVWRELLLFNKPKKSLHTCRTV